MSVTYGFYDSLNHDRTYSTLQFSSIFDGIISDGIYATYMDALQVVASSPTSMNINVKPGRAWFNHTWTLNDAILVLTVEEADVALPRIDTVVLEINTGATVRANRIFIKKGTPASSPVAPTLIHGTDGVYQYGLANIQVAKQANIVTNGGIRTQDIVNLRGTSETPFVAGIINTINIDNLIAGWSDEFDAMFEELEVQISQAASQTLIDGSVTTIKIADNAVTTEKIANGSVTAEKFGGGGLVDLIYPIGSIYMSVNSTSPAFLFGGTWEQIKDKFLLSSGDNYTAGTTGGEASHVLSAEEMPSHNHNIPVLSGTAASNGAHTHRSDTLDGWMAYKGGSTGGDSARYRVAAGASYYTIGAITQSHLGYSGSTTSAGSHAHSVSINANTSGLSGSGNAHNNMPPYLSVYMWTRVA